MNRLSVMPPIQPNLTRKQAVHSLQFAGRASLRPEDFPQLDSTSAAVVDAIPVLLGEKMGEHIRARQKFLAQPLYKRLYEIFIGGNYPVPPEMTADSVKAHYQKRHPDWGRDERDLQNALRFLWEHDIIRPTVMSRNFERIDTFSLTPKGEGFISLIQSHIYS